MIGVTFVKVKFEEKLYDPEYDPGPLSPKKPTPRIVVTAYTEPSLDLVSGSFSCFEDDVGCCHYACDVLDYKLKMVKLILSDFKDALLPFKDEQEAGI